MQKDPMVRLISLHDFISCHIFHTKKYRDSDMGHGSGMNLGIEGMHLKPWRSHLVLQRSQGVDQWVVG